MEVIDHKKPQIEDKELKNDVKDEELSQHILKKIFCVGKTFRNVSFKQSEIINCYFRNCRFIKCDFTGSSIKSSNFKGSQYEDCKFQYSSWEHTQIDEEFLENCLPSEENLARDLVRSLRVNFGQIGNYPAVNKTAAIEVKLTGEHLYNAAYSKQSYYRSKYKGLNRAKHVVNHAIWKALDILWDNGESLSKIVVNGAIVLFAWSFFITEYKTMENIIQSLTSINQVFWGVPSDAKLPTLQAIILTGIRYILFGLFMSVLIKRLARR